MRPGGALSPWIPVDRISMPVERLKNAATILYINIYLGTPAGQSCHQSTQRTLEHPQIAHNPVQLMGPPQVSMGHELSSFGLGQDDYKTYSPLVSLAENLSHPGVKERCRDPKTGGKLEISPFRLCRRHRVSRNGESRMKCHP
jgi:hypothetical protein